MRKPYRVAVMGPGNLGLCAIRELHRMSEMELVGVLAYSTAKHGVDAGELAGIGPIGIKATTNFDEFLKLDVECVLHASRDYGDWRGDEEVLALLEAGKNVISALPYHYVNARGDEVHARFKAAAEKGGATLHGSGENPNFYNERLAMLLTGLCLEVRSIRFQEFFNIGLLKNVAETMRILGFGIPPEHAEKNGAAANIYENHFRQTFLYVAEKLGVIIERIERTARYQAASAAVETPSMTIAAGTVGLVCWTWTAYADGKPFYSIEAWTYAGEAMRPAAATAEHFCAVSIDGRPSVEVTLAGLTDEPTAAAFQMTLATMIQAIPAVVAAPPGLMLPEMPQFHWKPDLRA